MFMDEDGSGGGAIDEGMSNAKRVKQETDMSLYSR